MSGTALDPELEAHVAGRLRGAEQRLTANRRALVEVLAQTSRPLTIPDILERRPGLALSSAYRNLTVLEHAGIVHRVVAHRGVTNEEHARYELAEDLTEHHHHLVCATCGGVEDVPASAGLERSMQTAAAAIEARTGFRTEHHRIDLVGTCRDCA